MKFASGIIYYWDADDVVPGINWNSTNLERTCDTLYLGVVLSGKAIRVIVIQIKKMDNMFESFKQ